MPRPAGRDHSLYFDYPHYPFRRPPELDGEVITHDVAIVGAGPVGVTAALELARHGIRSVVVDDKDTVNDGSRAICIARHSLEILQQLNLSERFTGKALPWTHGTSFYRTKPVFRLEMPHSEQERFYPMYNLQQQYVELFLVEAAQSNSLVDLRWRNSVKGIDQDRDRVRLQVETPEGDYSLSARYVLAADGARSAVRRLFGLKLNGEAYEGRYVIVDIRMHSDYPTERRAFFDPPANPGATVLIHKQPEDIWRVDYQLNAEDNEEDAIREDRIREKVSAILEMIGETGPWDLEWWSIYKAFTLALDDYRRDRVLFVGDAAHLVPIFGVRGLNSGLADAANVGWKLAYVLQGLAPDTLLDSYTPERRGATLDVFCNAVRSTRFMTPPTNGFQLMRDAALSLAVNHEFTRKLLDPRQSRPYTYADSLITSFRERDAQFESGPCAGAPLPNRRVGQDDYLLDHLGNGFTGLYFLDKEQPENAAMQIFSTLSSNSTPFKLLVIAKRDTTVPGAEVILDQGGAIFAGYGAEDGSFYLVRPDRHICARWRRLVSEELRTALRRALGDTS